MSTALGKCMRGRSWQNKERNNIYALWVQVTYFILGPGCCKREIQETWISAAELIAAQFWLHIYVVVFVLQHYQLLEYGLVGSSLDLSVDRQYIS